ncbi:protein of unknown function [Candidatus Nitrosocosmicus franklandus]|uniref:Uncharacterized protein n=1 Tax=Candidatus Nitrosocosmicus franklandianus TaxID=1798806 RepID=A0A484IAJ2_9ARCH|nr:protein of unknown function [Candidatus Nitrosocosmicus franklandus]
MLITTIMDLKPAKISALVLLIQFPMPNSYNHIFHRYRRV